MSPLDFSFTAIARVESPFKGKFGVPRQPALASRARARIVFRDDPDLRAALRGLEGFSHAWVIFVFHLHGAKKWKPSVRPPRLGGDVKMGVLASRSMHRPNPIGLSCVRIESVDVDAAGGPVVAISGHDLLDGTPVLDLKPYLPYADAVADASSAWAAAEVPRRPVLFSAEALRAIESMDDAVDFEALLHEVLGIDPRPAYQQRKLPADDPRFFGRRFGFEFMGREVKYELRAEGFYVLEIVPL